MYRLAAAVFRRIPRDLAVGLAKRSVQDDGSDSMPSLSVMIDNLMHAPWWVPVVFIANIIVVVPLLLYVSYTIGTLYPTLGLLEDADTPPTYERIPSKEDAELKGAIPADLETTGGDGDTPKPVNASLRATHRLLYSIGGWTSLFRGMRLNILLILVCTCVELVIGLVPFFPGPLAELFAIIATAQLDAAWTHRVISKPSSKSFWQCMPSLWKTMRATAGPIILANTATVLAVVLPMVFLQCMGFKGVPIIDLGLGGPKPQASDVQTPAKFWAAVVVSIVSFVGLIFILVAPTHAILIRIQASMLPEDEQTIVPFDPMFGLKQEVKATKGQEYLSITQAMDSLFNKPTMVRLAKVCVKIIGILIAFEIVLIGVTVAQFITITEVIRSQAH